MDKKYTPAPWTARIDPTGEHWHIDHKNTGNAKDATCNGWTSLAIVFNAGGWEDDPEGEANARLIASAPELLEALQECIDELFLIHSKYGDHQNAIDHCPALGKGELAIQKATGEK